MSTWIYRLARACWRARRRVVAAWLLVIVALGGLAATIGGGFDDEFRIPGASSQVALDQLRMTFPEAAMSSASIVILAPPGAKVTDDAVRAQVEATASALEEVEWIALAQLPYNEYVKGLISDDETAALLNVRVDGYSVSTFTEEQRQELRDAGARLQAALPGSEVHVGGDLFAMNMPTVTPVEGIGVLLAVVVLVVVLGSLRAAMMPIVSALVGAGTSILLIVAAAGITPINSTTMILALMLALAVGIDYSLFVVSRHRDQLATGMEVEESAARATATAGSAVVFAGLTVIIALVGLGVAGIPFLTTMGVFAALAVAIEVALSLTLLPAMLGFAGESLRPKPKGTSRWPWRRASLRQAQGTSAQGTSAQAQGMSAQAQGTSAQAQGTSAQAQGTSAEPVEAPMPQAEAGFNASRWWVGVVTKVPALTIVLVVLGLGALTIPAQHLQLALPNSGRNEPAAPDRITFDVISDRFGVGYNGPLVITGTIVESDDPVGLIDELKADVEQVPGVKMVAMAVPNPNADTALIQVIPTTGPDDPATTELVHRLRALFPQWEAEHGVRMALTGFTAVAIDVSSQLAGALLPFGIFVVGLSLVLLAVVFRSVWVPVKAALGYLLSVGAAFGLTTLVFNQGIGKQFVNLHDAQPIISFLPIILMGILFGLAMDYEVFLTSRMREEYVHGNHTNPTEAGFVHSAKVVVAAAIIMIAVFAFFIPEGGGTIKPIAFGLAVGVAFDAFLVRMTLGPAVMRLLHGAAWWLPPYLAKRLPHLDAEGEALAHQLSLADWPRPGATQVIYGEGLGAATDHATLFEGVDLELEPGRTLVVTGDPAARRALLLALTGRLTLTSGELKVLGLVLPQEAGTLRRRATFVDADDPDAARALADPVGDLVAVDGADRLSADARAALIALVQRAATPAAVPAGAGADAVPPRPDAGLTLVLGASDADRVHAFLPPARDRDELPLGGAL